MTIGFDKWNDRKKYSFLLWQAQMHMVVITFCHQLTEVRLPSWDITLAVDLWSSHYLLEEDISTLVYSLSFHP